MALFEDDQMNTSKSALSFAIDRPLISTAIVGRNISAEHTEVPNKSLILVSFGGRDFCCLYLQKKRLISEFQTFYSISLATKAIFGFFV